MTYNVHKLTFSEGRAYRYIITDESGATCCTVEPTGLSLPDPTRLLTLCNAEGQPVGRLEPAPFTPWWWTRHYALILNDQDAPQALIEECWTMVDRILLRPPSYMFYLGKERYLAHGSHYGERFYELFLPAEVEEPALAEEVPEEEVPAGEIAERLALQQQRRGEKVGEVLRPPSGADYLIEVEVEPLRQAPLVLAVLVVLTDLYIHGL